MSWTIYGVIASQFADSDCKVTVSGQSTSTVVKDYLKENMGFEHNFLGYVVLDHFGCHHIFHPIRIRDQVLELPKTRVCATKGGGHG
uniref:Uncharacterized protein n=1 Tax=Leersia perrieri TaxID=77586 RepID=A0A0D9WZK5_9ORYZ